MTRPAVDLAIERIVVEGIELTPAQQETLARLLERDLVRMLSGGTSIPTGHGGLLESTPGGLATNPDPVALARVLAERVAAEVVSTGTYHV